MHVEWKYKNMNYPPEYDFSISGRVRKKFADVPIKKAVVNIGLFDKGKPLIEVVPTDSAGRFCLKGVDLTGDAKLIASITSDKDKLKGWLLLDSSRYTPATVKDIIAQTMFFHTNDQLVNDDQLTSENQLINKNIHTFVQYAEIKKSIQKKYRLSDTINPGEVTITAKRSDAPESALSRSRRYLMGTPDASLIVTSQLEKYGTTGQLFKIGIFYSPKHHTTLLSDYKPDLRTTLFWEPNIKLENNKDLFLNYYNIDNPSKVKVIVEGITTTGIPVTAKTEYEVR
jgi:hypothetical protein